MQDNEKSAEIESRFRSFRCKEFQSQKIKLIRCIFDGCADTKSPGFEADQYPQESEQASIEQKRSDSRNSTADRKWGGGGQSDFCG